MINTSIIPSNSTIIIGLSGGPDSVYLLHQLVELRAQSSPSGLLLASHKNLTLIAAHLDHGWRKESGEDVKFCQNLCEQLGVRFVTRKISELPTMPKFNGSKEEFARRSRRQFFDLVKKEHNANFVALAHHQDDQAETFFIRLIRGAGITGLTAMRARDGFYVRPLLHIKKADILAYLHANNIPYLTDYTNDSHDFLRNRIRHTALPALQTCDARFNHNLMSSIEKLQEADAFLHELTLQEFECLQEKNDAHSNALNLTEFLKLHPFMQHRILLHLLCTQRVPFNPSSAFFAEINRFLLQPGTKKHTMHATWAMVKTTTYFGIVKIILKKCLQSSHYPNKATLKAIKDAEQGKGLVQSNSLDDLFKK